MRFSIMATAALCAALTGCATTAPSPSKEGAGPYPYNHEHLFSAYLSTTLKDPFSAQVHIAAGPSPFSRPGGMFASAISGWGTCYLVNAKNSFGGYTGSKWYVAIVRDGTLTDVVKQEGGNIYSDIEISKFCNTAGAPNANAPISTAPPPQNSTTTPGARVTRELLATLKPGVTTKAEVVSLFGVPTAISSMQNGTLLQWMAQNSSFHVAILFANDSKESLVKITHSFFH